MAIIDAALTKNAAVLQQQSLVKMMGAHREAAAIVNGDVTDAILSGIEVTDAK